MSVEGRVGLINSVLNGMHIFTFSFYKAPFVNIKEIVRI